MEKSKRKKSVLIIDDSIVNNYVCEIIVKDFSNELNVKSFSNSEEALDYLKNTPDVDFILLDLSMPIVDGWEILDFLNKSHKNTQVVVLTSSLKPEDEKNSYLYPNVIGFITKPPTIDSISQYLIKFSEEE